MNGVVSKEEVKLLLPTFTYRNFPNAINCVSSFTLQNQPKLFVGDVQGQVTTYNLTTHKKEATIDAKTKLSDPNFSIDSIIQVVKFSEEVVVVYNRSEGLQFYKVELDSSNYILIKTHFLGSFSFCNIAIAEVNHSMRYIIVPNKDSSTLNLLKAAYNPDLNLIEICSLGALVEAGAANDSLTAFSLDKLPDGSSYQLCVSYESGALVCYQLYFLTSTPLQCFEIKKQFDSKEFKTQIGCPIVEMQYSVPANSLYLLTSKFELYRIICTERPGKGPPTRKIKLNQPAHALHLDNMHNLVVIGCDSGSLIGYDIHSLEWVIQLPLSTTKVVKLTQIAGFRSIIPATDQHRFWLIANQDDEVGLWQA